MRTDRGWRTRASARPTRHPEYAIAPSAAPALPAPLAESSEGQTEIEPRFREMPWKGVDWSIALIGFLAYIWVIITYSVAIGDAAVVVALVGVLMQPHSLRLPTPLLLFGAFILWGAAGFLLTDYPELVYSKLIDLGKIWLIMLVAVNALRTRAQIRFFIFFFLAAFALYPLRGAIFNYVGGYRLLGRAIWNYIYRNPNDLAAISLIPLSMVLALYGREPRGWPKLAAFAGIVMIPMLILMTQSRGAIIALAVFGLIALAGQKRRLRALLVTTIVVLVGMVAAPEEVWQRMANLRNATDTENLESVDEVGSAAQRFEIWKVGLIIFSENPVAGVGVGAYSRTHGVTALRGEVDRIARGNRDTHSTFLNVAAETGSIGLLLFLGIFVSTMVHAQQVRRRIRDLMPDSAQQLYYLQAGLVAYFTAGVFGSFAKLFFPYLLAALIYALATIADQDHAALVAGTRSGDGRRR